MIIRSSFDDGGVIIRLSLGDHFDNHSVIVRLSFDDHSVIIRWSLGDHSMIISKSFGDRSMIVP